jgi:hypothetical protein
MHHRPKAEMLSEPFSSIKRAAAAAGLMATSQSCMPAGLMAKDGETPFYMVV